MTKLPSIILALTCATLHAQSVVVKGTGAGAVRGNASVDVATNVVSVLTNLTVTGTLNPDVTGTNYTQTADVYGNPAWANSTIGASVHTDSEGVSYGLLFGDAVWSILGGPVGDYLPALSSTGTATVAYWYQTNYSSSVSVTIHGKATP